MKNNISTMNQFVSIGNFGKFHHFHLDKDAGNEVYMNINNITSFVPETCEIEYKCIGCGSYGGDLIHIKK
jgi:hypothetical protein